MGRFVIDYDGSVPPLLGRDPGPILLLSEWASERDDWPEGSCAYCLLDYLNWNGHGEHSCCDQCQLRKGVWRAYDLWEHLAYMHYLPEADAVTRLTGCELGAIARPNPTGDPSAHTFHVAVVSFSCGRTAGQVVSILETHDPVTRERWGAPGRHRLRGQEIREMLPRAAAAARPCKYRHEWKVQ